MNEQPGPDIETNSGPTRRRFLTGLGAVGVTVGLSGCVGTLYDVAEYAGSKSADESDLAYGDTVGGTITEDGPEDPKYGDLTATHTFEGSEGDTVEITLSSEAFDTYLILTGPGEDVVAEDDDGGAEFNSKLVIALPEDGVYTIWVGSYSGESTGEYTLSLTETEGVADGSDTSALEEPTISYGEEIRGRIATDGARDPEYGDRTDRQAFDGNAGDTVEISMTADEFDTYLILTGPDGTELVAEDDDGGSGTNSTIVTDLPADGVYTIWAGSYSGTDTGEYTLSVTLQ